MNATRLSTDPLAHEMRDLKASRPVLSGQRPSGGGFLAGLLRALLPFRSSGASSATTMHRAEPRLRAARVEEPDSALEGRREPYLMAQRRPTPGTAD
jgi:hypothetical protein